MSAYYATGNPAQGTEQATLAPVLVAFAGPAPQSRLTVLVRLILAIPQFVVVWLLGIAAMVVVLIGWFGALFTGRLPVFATRPMPTWAPPSARDRAASRAGQWHS
jgi:Domain of unknown function (DUF4389)